MNLCDNRGMADLPASPPSFPQPSPQAPPFKAFGDYEIEGELGRGGMGVVYLARQVELNRRVALKMLTGRYGPDELQRFLEESETAAGLNHTNIAHVYEVGEHDGTPFFSMEYVEAGSLADALRKELPSPRDAARLMLSVSRALHFAHQNGVVHRDMKPANVLLDPDGVPKITDFGIAKRLKADTKLTQTGAVIGTPTYMAPEQARGDSRHVGPAADIYSLGAILYEMLAGRPPFLPEDGETPVTVRVLTEDPVSPAWHRPEIPRDLETICMKCLEKEPRNRYESAAALAEDLRRYLDDESIQARPPSTISNSIKWLRRHPWKFVGITTALLLVVAGLALLARWEFYGRSRMEYATQLVWVNGRLEPIEKISQEQASQRAAYLRLTRRGRSGLIAKVEVLNARGYPAELRRIFNTEMIPIYIEGLAGAQPYTEKLPETTSVEFLYDNNDNTQEVTGRERNGQVTWRIIYDSQHTPGQPARARFVNLRGFDAPTPNGASHMEFERDAKGRDTKINFFNTAGQPAANGEGVYGYKLEYDDMGRVVHLVNLGADGKPAPNRAGLTAFTTSWGKEIRSEVRDSEGKPALWNQVATIVIEQDEAGNPVRISNLDSDGKPVRSPAPVASLPGRKSSNLNAGETLSVIEMKRNEHGEVTQRTYFKTESDGSLKQLFQFTISYDDFGHPAAIQFNGATFWWTARRNEANGNIVEERYLDAQGKLIKGEMGYAIKRRTYTLSSEGLRVEETYFDEAEAKTYSKGGYHRTINEFSTTGSLRRQTLDEHDPAQSKFYRIISEPEYDPQGRRRRNITRFEDAQGQLATSAGLLYPISEEIFDDSGRVVTKWEIGYDPANIGGPILRIDTEWRAGGTMKSRVQEVCDADRNPMLTLSNGNAARTQQEFDLDERLERIYETGFDENLIGFASRDAKFSQGKLQSIIRLRKDGTRVDSVNVIIYVIVPSPDQPKSAELKEGDQIVAANGQPVTSGYGFLTSFSEGWIEVLREGERIRIDGFNKNQLGVGLQERAPVRQ